MKTWARLAVAAALATAAVGPGALPSWGQSTPTTKVAVKPLGPLPGEPGGPTEVHSWALAPALNNPSQGGDRPNLSYEVAAGTEVEDEITLYNLSNVQLTFRLYATDAFNNADGSFDLLPGEKAPSSVGTWVTLPQANITLPARTQASMPITVKVPLTARPGDHAGAVIASSSAAGTGPDGKVISLDRRTGPRMYVRVAGPLTPKLTVERLDTSYGYSLNPLDGTAEVAYRIVNRGNVRMAGKQHVSVSGPAGLLGKRKPATDIPELLPGEGVDVRVKFDGVATTGVAVGKVRLDPVPVGNERLSATNGRAFALAPPITLLVLGLVVWLLQRSRRNYVRRQAAGAWTGTESF